MLEALVLLKKLLDFYTCLAYYISLQCIESGLKLGQYHGPGWFTDLDYYSARPIHDLSVSRMNKSGACAGSSVTTKISYFYKLDTEQKIFLSMYS